MTDYRFQLPDALEATALALIEELGFNDAEGRLKPGVAYDIIPTMEAIPAVVDGGGEVTTPAVPHNGGHLNIRTSGAVAAADVRAPTGEETENGSLLRDHMDTNNFVATHSIDPRPGTVRTAPTKATLIEDITHKQRVYA